MIKALRLKPVATLVILAAALAGCATQSGNPAAKPAPAAPASEAANASSEYDEVIKKAAAQPLTPEAGQGWQSLFDGRTLAGWRPTDFSGRGDVHCEAGAIVIGMGSDLTGINWTNEIPNGNYEVALDAMRVNGSDFFCGLTFPVGDSHCSLIMGGWGGAVTGISSIDGLDASENETTQFLTYDKGQWYHLRVRVTDAKIEAWVDGKRIVNLSRADKKITMRYGEIEMSKPFGIASWETTGALRDIKLRRINPAGDIKK